MAARSRNADALDNWTTQLRKGVLELAVLSALDGEERYGYELVKRLVAVPGLGVTEGTLYPLLSRLRTSGLVAARLEESPAGPARKYYRLTREGRRTVELMDAHLASVLAGIRDLRTG